MVVHIVRGTRSEKYAAEDWTCDECGHLNKKKEFLVFDLPPFYCENTDCYKVVNYLLLFTSLVKENSYVIH